MSNFGPVVPPAGPCPARICIVAEAPGSEESEALAPLVGLSGRELRRMLRTVGINLDDCYRTNVFSRQPTSNNIGLYGTPLSTPETRNLGALTRNPMLYLDPAHLAELDRLRSELVRCSPNIVLALGNIACWALLGLQGISELRGTIATSWILGPDRPLKVLPTFHPAAVLRQWDWRVIAIADLEKARAEAEFTEVRYDNTELWLSPTLDDLVEFDALYMRQATIVAVDVETKRGQIDCISFAPSPDVSICVPFWCRDGEDYWPTVEQEAIAWAWVRKHLENPSLIKVMQNGMYDIQYMIRHNIRPANCTEDTMLAHHSLYSELRKGLGFLGSVYANRPGWKQMATFKKEEQLKRDD